MDEALIELESLKHIQVGRQVRELLDSFNAEFSGEKQVDYINTGIKERLCLVILNLILFPLLFLGFFTIQPNEAVIL